MISIEYYIDLYKKNKLTERKLSNLCNALINDYLNTFKITFTPFNAEYFVEMYLGRTLNYYQLTDKGNIMGFTSLVDNIYPIISENGSIEFRELKKGEICIDLLACNSETRTIYSIIHECFHSLFDIYKTNKNKKEIYSALKKTKYKNLPEIIKGLRENKKSERFANLFAANILMPKEYFSLKFYKYKEEILGNGKFSKNSRNVLFSIIYKLKNEFSCSVAAIAWRLFELRLITKNMFKILDIK